jgi:predicted secreted protein
MRVVRQTPKQHISKSKVSRFKRKTQKYLILHGARYSKSDIQLQEHPDGIKTMQSLLSMRMMNAPGIVASI